MPSCLHEKHAQKKNDPICCRISRVPVVFASCLVIRVTLFDFILDADYAKCIFFHLKCLEILERDKENLKCCNFTIFKFKVPYFDKFFITSKVIYKYINVCFNSPLPQVLELSRKI